MSTGLWAADRTGGDQTTNSGTLTLQFDPARAAAIDLAARRARTKVFLGLLRWTFRMPGRVIDWIILGGKHAASAR